MSKSESGQVWLVLGEQREGLGLEKSFGGPPCRGLSVSLSGTCHLILLACVVPVPRP